MPSWQSYGLDLAIRLLVKRKLRRVTTVKAARAAFGKPLPAPKGARFAQSEVGGVAGEWVCGAGQPAGTLLYLHGGGYSACSPITHRPITGALALHGLRVFAPDYRLAPEHPFPAALDDALAAYRGLLASGLAPARLVIAGDSAGGGLALATLLAARAAGLPLPACALLFSPWTDLAGTGASVTANARRDAMLDATRISHTAGLYLNGMAAENPLASPLYGDLAGLPPLLLQVSDKEILLDDSTRLAARAQAAGVRVECKIWPGLPHVWPLFQAFLPEGREALAQAAAFALRHLA